MLTTALFTVAEKVETAQNVVYAYNGLLLSHGRNEILKEAKCKRSHIL